MKKNHLPTRGPHESEWQLGQPERVGWVRKFCGKGIFREIWKNRFIVLKGDQLMICEKEGKEVGDEVLDLCDFERCEEMRNNKSRSKKNHSKFRLQRRSPGNEVPNVLFLAVSPEDKESWISVLNVAITRAKNQILDEVTVEEAHLCHLTRDRAKIPHNRRLPTRSHLLAVASSSEGMMTLDLIQEEDISAPPGNCNGCQVNTEKSQSPSNCRRSRTDGAFFSRTAKASGKSQSLPREGAVAWEQMDSSWTSGSATAFRTPDKNRCASMDEILGHSEKNRTTLTPHTSASTPISRLQELISLKLAQTERLLEATQNQPEGEAGKAADKAEEMGAKAERLLKEAVEALDQAHEVLEEVKELRELYRQLDTSGPNRVQGPELEQAAFIT
ncbi:pleckstrin homology domain-containing family O member 1b [Dunckerocampus dactyliophorus]|uniref:pleckstrin homology domain-containing family O member 1b n=1 Tax=Dunckerocampus dactyliophorus TaxID=161453 RepID=UPI002405299A|nr:pleckstrin homology domain-containing family O member 1b [Dunckerocampus dactyliophorus]